MGKGCPLDTMKEKKSLIKCQIQSKGYGQSATRESPFPVHLEVVGIVSFAALIEGNKENILICKNSPLSWAKGTKHFPAQRQDKPVQKVSALGHAHFLLSTKQVLSVSLMLENLKKNIDTGSAS